MSANMAYRRLCAADLPAVADIEMAVQIEPWSRAQVLEIAGLLDGGYVAWVAEDAFGQVQAYLIAQVVIDEAEILTIGVAHAAQGQGVGAALLVFGLMDIRACYPDVQACFLEVRVSNAVARTLYDKNGFVEVGRRKHYYHDPVTGAREDALILRCDVIEHTYSTSNE
ncbi:ribosomal protein S18-alanine N-acetyltransferase [Ephemeroptericola cinctiostellae]|nr:ribosomal protein S18-alanine N-acetyltransferase [Ephemeroptericola cinctiostellae]